VYCTLNTHYRIVSFHKGLSKIFHLGYLLPKTLKLKAFNHVPYTDQRTGRTTTAYRYCSLQNLTLFNDRLYDTILCRCPYLTCSKRWRVASLVHHTGQTEKLKKNELKINREAW